MSDVLRPVVTAHLFFVSLPKHRTYVLYQATIIWVFLTYSTIGKKFEKGEPSDLIFYGGQKVEHFFSPFLDPQPVYEFL
jgi:hypothetical protein